MYRSSLFWNSDLPPSNSERKGQKTVRKQALILGIFSKIFLMKTTLLKYTLVTVMFLISCKEESKAQKSGANHSVVNNANPETAKRNTSIPPAFDGQTRIKAVKTKTGYTVEAINAELGRPWAIVNFTEGRFLTTDKSGHMHIISADGQSISRITGFPAVDDKGQGGMLDVALDPDYATNRTIYWSFTEPFKEGNHTAVGKGRISDDEQRVENPQVIFRATPTYDGDKHYGSRLAFDQQGMLYLSTGERSDRKTRPLAQDQQTYYGKIIRITRDGKAAPGNPVPAGWKPEIFATGLRNPQGIAFHPETGELWEAEMGPKGGDEINLILAGKNYGWPTITYGEEYNGLTIGSGIGHKEELEQPVYFWDPSVSPSGIDFYTGSIEEWKNNLFVGCLSGNKIIRLVIEGHKVTGEEWLLEDQNERFRDVLSGADGNLYGVTDSGKLYKISKK